MLGSREDSWEQLDTRELLDMGQVITGDIETTREDRGPDLLQMPSTRDLLCLATTITSLDPTLH